MSDFGAFVNRKFGEYQLRLGRRLTVTEFAELIGTDQGTLSHWLKGRRPPQTIDAIKALASNPLIGPEIWQVLVPNGALLLRALQALENLPEEQQVHFVNKAEEAAKRNRAEKENGAAFQYVTG